VRCPLEQKSLAAGSIHIHDGHISAARSEQLSGLLSNATSRARHDDYAPG